MWLGKRQRKADSHGGRRRRALTARGRAESHGAGAIYITGIGGAALPTARDASRFGKLLQLPTIPKTAGLAREIYRVCPWMMKVPLTAFSFQPSVTEPVLQYLLS